MKCRQMMWALIVFFVAGCAAQTAELDTPDEPAQNTEDYETFEEATGELGTPDEPAQNIEDNETLDEATGDESTVSDTNSLAAGTSINSLETIHLGGVEQWIQIQSNDITKPILLVLHGWPGNVMMPLMHDYCRTLEDQFIVVNWDQRGAGKSYSPDILESSMTLDQLLEDAHELTVALKERFGRDRIFLLGHSDGTMLGILLINSHPKDYLGYIGVGQFVDFIKTESSRYEFALQKAKADSNTDAVSQLSKVGHPNDKGEYEDESGYQITHDWIGYFGGSLYQHNSDKEIVDAIINSDVYADDYDAMEKGWELSDLLYDDEDVWYLDLKEEVIEVGVPVYFLLGRHDQMTSKDLVVQYYLELKAPVKEIIWFENSAHFPFFEESDLFSQALINIGLSTDR